MSDLSQKPPANYAPVYAAIYPELAEVFRKHGYALAIHGSLRRDFDLIAVPWIVGVSTPFQVVKEVESEFAIKRVGSVVEREHGRLVVSLSIGHGECAVDLSFTPKRGRSQISALGELANSTTSSTNPNDGEAK